LGIIKQNGEKKQLYSFISAGLSIGNRNVRFLTNVDRFSKLE